MSGSPPRIILPHFIKMFDHLNLEIWGRWWHYLTSAGSYRGGFTPKHTEKHLMGTLFYPILIWTNCSVVVLYMVVEKIQVSWVKPRRNVNQLAWNPTHLGKICRNLRKLFDVNTSKCFFSCIPDTWTNICCNSARRKIVAECVTRGTLGRVRGRGLGY